MDPNKMKNFYWNIPYNTDWVKDHEQISFLLLWQRIEEDGMWNHLTQKLMHSKMFYEIVIYSRNLIFFKKESEEEARADWK